MHYHPLLESMAALLSLWSIDVDMEETAVFWRSGLEPPPDGRRKIMGLS